MHDFLAPNLFDLAPILSIATEAHKTGEYRFPVAVPILRQRLVVNQNMAAVIIGSTSLHLPHSNTSRNSGATSKAATPVAAASSMDAATDDKMVDMKEDHVAVATKVFPQLTTLACAPKGCEPRDTQQRPK